MITFAEMERRLMKLDINSITGDSIEETADVMLVKQRQQMSDGLYKTGDPITPPYATRTLQVKRVKGQETRHVTLQDTRLMKDMMYVEVRPKSYIIDSKRVTDDGDLLSPILEGKYTSAIWGLGGRYKAEYISSLREAMKSNIQLKLSNGSR